MDLVIDANVLFAMLIKEGGTIEIAVKEEVRLFAPQFILEEFRKHEEEILAKTKRTAVEFNEICANMKELITVIPSEEFTHFLTEAEKISPDPDDSQYFALALKLNCAIWSNDKKLKEQSKIKVYTTEELLKMFSRG